MLDRALSTFLKQAFAADLGAWNESSVRDLAEKNPPHGLGGSFQWLLTGDVNYLWARWFLEGLVDPSSFRERGDHYVHLLNDIQEAIDPLMLRVPEDEKREITFVLADIWWEHVKLSEVVERHQLDREMRLTLWDQNQRCWICGAEFPDWARQKFLEKGASREVEKLPYVDAYKPRGLQKADLQVEIEHVVAHSAGGADDESNLRLACGWCNRAKAARTLLYDAEGSPRFINHPDAGRASVPQPFWVVRLLAMRGRCEALSCDSSTLTHELTAAPRNLRGSPNPANLMVVCQEHDPLADWRLVPSRCMDAS